MTDYARLLRPRTASVEVPASFSRRAFALITDVLIIDLVVTAPFTPLFTPLMARLEAGSWFSLTYTSAELAAMMVVFALAFAYFALFEYALGQTPGMMLMNTRVRQPLRLWQAFARNAFLIPFGPVIALWIIEPLSVALTRTSLLERLTRTRTVYARHVLI